MDHRDNVVALSKIYGMVQDFIRMPEYDKPLQDELMAAFPKYMEILTASKRDLTRADCGIVITGETSAGKTSLINLVIQCKNLFPTSNLATTGKVCRLRNSDRIGLSLFKKDESLIKEEIVKDLKSLKKVIKKFTDLKECPDEFKDVYYVDVSFNIPMLQGNVIIVDTPGIGETEELDQMLLDFLPHAVSFIFIVNAQNAGGIHNDRLMKIFRKIIENRDKMPCFDPRDVFFLTNKWDGIDDDSSEEDDSDNDDDEDEDKSVKTRKLTEKEKTWNLIQDRLRKGWALISEDKLFRLSLKQISKGEETEFTKEYTRFQEVLKETIKINQNKRLKFYYSFLIDFIQNAERGTLARIRLLDRSEEEQQEIIRKNKEKIQVIDQECRSKRIVLLEMKGQVVFTLADRLHKYINSDAGKEVILFRKGGQDIMSVRADDLKTLIPKRIEEGMQIWCGGHEYKEVMREVSNKIETSVKEIHIQIGSLERDMTGTPMATGLGSIGIGAAFTTMGLGFLLFAPISIAFAFVFAFIWTPIAWVLSLYETTESRRKKIDIIYLDCMKQISVIYLQDMFEKSFGVEYTKLILVVFEKEFPKQLDNLGKINEKLLGNLSEMKKNRDSLLKLHRVVKTISTATTEFRKQHSEELCVENK